MYNVKHKKIITVTKVIDRDNIKFEHNMLHNIRDVEDGVQKRWSVVRLVKQLSVHRTRKFQKHCFRLHF